jgi:hypothetical protein
MVAAFDANRCPAVPALDTGGRLGGVPQRVAKGLMVARAARRQEASGVGLFGAEALGQGSRHDRRR